MSAIYFTHKFVQESPEPAEVCDSLLPGPPVLHALPLGTGLPPRQLLLEKKADKVGQEKEAPTTFLYPGDLSFPALARNQVQRRSILQHMMRQIWRIFSQTTLMGQSYPQSDKIQISQLQQHHHHHQQHQIGRNLRLRPRMMLP